LKKTLRELYDALGDRALCLARELTKINEEFSVTTLSEAISFYETTEPRGEYVLILEGSDEYDARCPGRADKSADSAATSGTEESPEDMVARLEASGLTRKEAIKAAAAGCGMSKSAFYSLLIARKNEADESN